jgi:glycosyltransferase involved in cell wall biosynthesis
VADAMDDPARCEAYGRAGREDVAADFSWPVIARRLHDVYLRVTERRARA